MATPDELRAQLKSRHDKDIIAKAIAALAARGCKYAVTEPDGDEHTNIVVELKKTKVMVNDFVADTGYLATIQALKPGHSDIVMVPPHKAPDIAYVDNLRSSIHNACKRAWGEKTYKVEIGEGRTHINIMRNEKFES